MNIDVQEWQDGLYGRADALFVVDGWSIAHRCSGVAGWSVWTC